MVITLMAGYDYWSIDQYDMMILNGGLQPYLCISTKSEQLLHFQPNLQAI